MLSLPAATARRLIGWAGLTISVDPWEAAKALRLDVELLPITSADGLVKRDQDGAWYVIVSSLLPHERQRFTLAHEIGHWCLHRRDREAFAHTSPSRGRYEREANQFAAELLMPLQELRRTASQMAFTSLAAYFEVSLEAMAIRLRETGLFL